MSVFDITPGNTSSAVQAIGSTGSVVNQDLHQEGSIQNPANNTSIAQSANGEKKIVLDGPLSEIYTKALNMVFSTKVEQAQDKLSQETQQMDAVLVADIHALSKEKKEAEIKEAQNAAYVYVTNDENLNSDGLISAFDNVRVALDSRRFNKAVVCVESNGLLNGQRIEMLTDMAKNFGAQVFYTRNATMKYLNRMCHE